MNEEKFIIEYCKTLDQCQGQRKDLLWFATWMSSKSPYFSFAKKYEALWQNQYSPNFTFYKKLKNALRLLVTAISLCMKWAYLRVIFHSEYKKLMKNPLSNHNLVRTFLYSSSPDAPDPFWNSLIDILSNQSLKLIVIYEPNFRIQECVRLKKSRPFYFPYILFLNPLQVLIDYCKILKEALMENTISYAKWNTTPLVRTCSKTITEKPFTQNLPEEYSESYIEELLTPATLTHLCFYRVFSKIFKNLKIQNAYVLFENNPWEKMLYIARNKFQDSTRCIGFQHTTLQKNATNYFLSNYEVKHRFIPDLILTTGEYPLRLLKTYEHYKNIPIVAGCALRHQYLELITPKNISELESLKLLVILDGTWDTTHLVNLTFEFASSSKLSIEIMLKEHPNLPYSKISNNHLPQNVQLFKGTLVESLLWTNVVLYTGSTTSLEALIMGIPVINFQSGLFNFDPLFELQNFKWNIRNNNELTNALIELKEMPLKKKLIHAEKAKIFVNNYFYPCRKENIERFL